MHYLAFSTIINSHPPTDSYRSYSFVDSRAVNTSQCLKTERFAYLAYFPDNSQLCPALLAPTPFACHAELLGIGETDLVCGLTCVNPGIMWQGLEFGEVERALAKPRGATWQNIITSFMKPQPKTQACDPPQPCRLATCPGSCPIEVVWTTRR